MIYVLTVFRATSFILCRFFSVSLCKKKIITINNVFDRTVKIFRFHELYTKIENNDTINDTYLYIYIFKLLN